MEIAQAIKAMSALAQESRLEVFRLLITCGEEGMPAGQIAEHLEIPAATLSFHLKELNNAGLIDQHREGRSLIYQLNVEAMRALFAYLMEDCCQGRPELCQPDYAESVCCDTENKPRRKKRATHK
jgi:DNA-binding transcriptional ArsR family regulator